MNRARDSVFLPPPPARPGDGNAWQLGPCWLWCGWRTTHVLWLGTVDTAGAHAPVYGCAACVALLHGMVWDYADAAHAPPWDARGRPVPLYQPVADPDPPVARRRPGRHRRPRTPLGARLQRR